MLGAVCVLVPLSQCGERSYSPSVSIVAAPASPPGAPSRLLLEGRDLTIAVAFQASSVPVPEQAGTYFPSLPPGYLLPQYELLARRTSDATWNVTDAGPDGSGVTVRVSVAGTGCLSG
eukprot:CAMPEP_0113667156 /NCGR_PEP_ID=MMETSP0038_2-20120614/3280_1 /TAXON_ID=2898 /ORGANISM="Cryptomonas paramecium" /LENGTH=117 /DNA_ID=CAMNT_0000582741 /DNA_START=126 /DNA_END=476 /DNA_ORIENTATION=+ /assembly_acc=CAM_ASM_000170